MELGVLGPFRVLRDGQPLPLGGPRQRAVLAVLALNVNRTLPAGRLIELVWAGEPPESAQGVLQTYIANLRKVLEPEGGPYQVLVSQAAGYELRLSPETIDAHRFERGVRASREALAAGEPGRAEALLGGALGLWRGPALGEFATEPFALGWARRLEELRLGAIEDRVEARLALGHHQELVPELESLVHENPLRERLAGQLMLALYRSERHAEASDVFRRTRAWLVEDTGLEPGTNLRNLLKGILNQDPALVWASPDAASATDGRGGTERNAAQTFDKPVRGPALSRALCPIVVGREKHLGLLEDALLEARQGVGQVVLLAGDAGVGKTRLASELGARARGLGITVLSGTCSEAELALPYLPFLEALGNYVARADLATLQRRLGPSAGDLGHLFPRLGRGLMDLTDPMGARLRLFEAVLALLELVAGEQGLLLVQEDLHWADASTRALLDYLARRLPSARVLVLGTYRGDEMHRKHPLLPILQGWKRSGLAATIQLEPLDAEMVGQVVEAILDETTLPDTRDFLSARCEGNPFVLEELLKEALDRGDIYRTEAGWERKELSQFRLPETVRETILRRLERMTDAQVGLLRAAAVLGQAFEDRALLAMLGPEQEATLQLALEACTREQLLQPVSGRSYRFRHALTREAVYEDVTATQRERLHGRAAEALESLGSSAVDIAHHLILAGEPGRALPVVLTAAVAAEAAFGYAEAADLYQWALQAERGPAERARLMWKLGRALARSGSEAEAEHYLQEAVVALEEVGEAADAARARVDLSRPLFWAGRADRAVQELDRAVKVLEPMGPSEDLAIAYGRHAFHIAVGSGDPNVAVDMAGRAVVMAEAVGSTVARLWASTLLGVARIRLDPDDDEASALLLRTGMEAASLGLPQLATATLANYITELPLERLADASAALEAMRRLKPDDRLTAGVEATLALFFGRPADQRKAAERMLVLSSDALTSYRSALFVAAALVFEGGAAEAKRLLPADRPAVDRQDRDSRHWVEMGTAWTEGDVDRAVALARGLLTTRSIFFRQVRPWSAAILLEAGLVDDVEMELSAELGSRSKARADVQVLRGQLAVARGDHQTAISLLEPVAELEASVGEAMVSSLARLALAEARVGLGDRQGARQDLETLRESALRRGHWLHQEMVRRNAARLRIELAMRPPDPSGSPSPARPTRS